MREAQQRRTCTASTKRLSDATSTRACTGRICHCIAHHSSPTAPNPCCANHRQASTSRNSHTRHTTSAAHTRHTPHQTLSRAAAPGGAAPERAQRRAQQASQRHCGRRQQHEQGRHTDLLDQGHGQQRGTEREAHPNDRRRRRARAAATPRASVPCSNARCTASDSGTPTAAIVGATPNSRQAKKSPRKVPRFLGNPTGPPFGEAPSPSLSNPRVHRHDKHAARSRRRKPPSIGSNPASLPTRAMSRYAQEEEDSVAYCSILTCSAAAYCCGAT